MGFFDLFGGGSGPEKAQKLKAKVVQRYGDPATRQKALEQLGEMRSPEAVAVLMERFTVRVDPSTTDADEKERTYELIRSAGREVALPPVLEFLRRREEASSWAVRLVESLLPEEEVLGTLVDMLAKLSGEYTRNPERKVVLLHHVTGKSDPRVAPVVLPYLEDMADDVKIAALRALGPLAYEPAREPMLRLLTADETARRVQTTAVQALHESGFGVQGYREKVEALLAEPYFVDREGVVKKRG